MNKRFYVVIVLFFIAVYAVSAPITKAASQIELTPTSGEPSSTVGVEGTEFAPSKAVSIGLGAEVTITDESVTVAGSLSGPYTGTTASHPIKSGSFKWNFRIGTMPVEILDLGNGLVDDNAGFVSVGLINYTSGFFSIMLSASMAGTSGNTVNYTTYEFDVTPDGLRTDGSGMLSGNFTVPDIWNGTHTVTVIDEAGNMATADFTVVGSDFIPEPLTVGAVVLLTSTAIAVSSYWMRKRSYTKNIA